MHALNSLGVGKQLAASGEPGQPPVLRDYKTGAVVREAEQPAAIQAKYGENFYHLHRCDLHRVLSEAVVANDPECVKVGHGLTNLSQDENGVTAPFSNGDVFAGDVRSEERRVGKECVRRSRCRWSPNP